MRITNETPGFDLALVFLNGRRVVTAMAADDDEGWVDIVAPEAMAPLTAEDLDKDLAMQKTVNPDQELAEGTAWAPIQTKRLTGKVVIKLPVTR